MATSGYILPSISRIVRTTRILPTTKAALGAIPSTVSLQKCAFSSTPEYNNRRPRRDNNRFRGLSSIYRSGIKVRMNIDRSELPKPSAYKRKVIVDPNHGLWGFFFTKDTLLPTPEEMSMHGRGWISEELRHKSWEDLHKLWWVTMKELNRSATAHAEFTRLELVDGIDELKDRGKQAKKTLTSIKKVLAERWYTWEDARKLAETDPTIDLTNARAPFTPNDYLEEDGMLEATARRDQLEKEVSPGFMAEEPRLV